MSDPNNPFAGLLGIPETKPANTTEYNEGNATLRIASKNTQEDEEAETINNIVENVFHFTINSNALERCPTTERQLVVLEELSEAVKPRIHIDLEALEQALFERLLLPNPESYVIPKTCRMFKDHVIQRQVFPYLFSSMQNLQSYDQVSTPYVKTALQKMRELIFRNAVTALKQPALFEDQNFGVQLVELLQHVDPQSHTFFVDIVEAFVADKDDNVMVQLKESMIPVLEKIQFDVNKSNLINLPIYILPSIQIFASNSNLALILMEACEPKKDSMGRLYQESVLGALLSLSVLPKTATSLHEFFDNPMDQSATSMMESSIWNASSHLINNLHRIFLTLLKAGPQMRNRLLTWIGKCLKSNAARGKLWNVQAGEVSAATMSCVSDGFMLNLGAVLLQLCQPFCVSADDPKSLKIDPTYGAVPPEECAAKSVHLDCLHSETCLLPAREGEDGQSLKRPTAEMYNFVTECFFMTQKCIDLGVRVCAEKLWRCGQDLGRAQRALSDVAASAHHLVEPMRQRSLHLMTKFLSMRCALLENDMLTSLNRLQAMTCTWLVQVAVRPDPPAPQPSYAPGVVVKVEMPVASPPPDTLRCIPEFVLENIVVLITMARRTVGAIAEEAEIAGLLEPALTLVLLFMGDSSRTYNPHLRARLAECLEAMLPNHPDDQQPLSSLASFYREQLFKEHPHRAQLVPCLLDVFVGIEMTGQSVQFEQKFNYRRPMYLVMDFLWGMEEHRDAFTRLAKEAESNMEAVHPPIFLRFVNLLMNDAIFLLDEALGNMAQIRTMQTAQESGAWNDLPNNEREQNLGNLSHIGMLARFDNILGRDTIRTLVRLTAHAPYVFCHPTLVERIASMLNYFLLHLVGPNKKNFKVKDMKEYEFEPASTVLDICRMYVQLGSNERFCAAVSDDGRSYSPQLFTLAEAVLVRIGGGGLIGSLQEVATRVGRLAEQRQRDEEILANAPEEFLDPIMSTIMMDPVVLPSSRTTVDRTTIARHLLSDQSDPFNRSPLSMDQVKSNTELKEKIQAWIAEQKQKIAQAETSNG
ncbi:ubiquitin conjugation factor E4 A [Ostrinia nubilalis]|uniref:ubiquitin conjugation factor E4 A n=1 Tax=Ostrinia nubilalis TaxID=29057 RepID=UPI00103F0DB8|nr:ubiquitin conjugation factor E4 A isoform X1 [Ostrinia furnacalis]XP_028165923.1 ubiquitin conjugation factor E4 A isoform X2 [Ostrinia furnacalis]